MGSVHYRGKTITDGGVNPTFNQHFEFQVHNDLELEVSLHNSNTITSDDLLGTVKVGESCSMFR